MTKPLALFDIDRTMFTSASYEPLIEAQINAGLLEPETAKRTDDALRRYMGDLLGYEDFVKEVTDVWAEGLTGKDQLAVEECTYRFFADSDGFFGYVKPTVELLLPTHDIYLITGSPQFTAQAVAKVFGLTNSISTCFEEIDGLFTGKVKTHLATRHDKKEAIKHLTDAHPFEGSIGFGDSEGDIEMLRAVQHAVCIRPTEGLRKIAEQHGWVVIESDIDLNGSEGLPQVTSLI